MADSVRSVWPLPPRTADAALVVGIAAGCFATAAAAGDLLDPPTVAAILVASGALWFRRRHPVAVAVVTLVACGIYYPVSNVDAPVLLAFVVALYTAAAEGRLVVASVLAAAGLLAFAYGEIRSGTSHLAEAAPFLLVGTLAAVVAVGAVVRNRRAYLRELEQRLRDVEQRNEAELRRSAAEERLRIAREVHD
ncbi:MAG: hypothetical protein L0H84_02160, partial [Pseudonocardia sp.]|nr:hypothetical protein [Pseudonocardia sp.]